MAGGDYYSCDICDSKTFYSADLQYHEDGKKHPHEIGDVGAMKVICENCADVYDIVIVGKTT